MSMISLKKTPRRISPLATNSPIVANRSPRSPLQESRQANRNAYPSPVSNSPTWRYTGVLPTPPSFADADYQRIHRETLAERSTASSSLEALEKAVHHVDNMSPGLALYSPRSQGSILDDFASIAAKSERSPPLGGNRVLEPIEDDLPTADETSQQAAAILLSVAENTAPLAPRRTQRTPRPTGKAVSSPLKVFRSEGKKAKTAATPLAKVQGDPAPKKVRPSFRLKDPVEGAVDGVGMAPQGITYKGMIYKVMKEDGGPLRLEQVWEAWKRIWPFYANMTDPEHIGSLGNSIRHTLSLGPSKCLFQLHPASEYPELVAAEKAKKAKFSGGFWSIIPGRTMENHSQFDPQERPPKSIKKKE